MMTLSSKVAALAGPDRAVEAKLATVQRNYDELAELIDEAHAVLQEIDNDD